MLDAWASELAGDLANAVINVNRVGIAVTLDDPHVGISQRAVTFTATSTFVRSVAAGVRHSIALDTDDR